MPRSLTGETDKHFSSIFTKNLFLQVSHCGKSIMINLNLNLTYYIIYGVLLYFMPGHGWFSFRNLV